MVFTSSALFHIRRKCYFFFSEMIAIPAVTIKAIIGGAALPVAGLVSVLVELAACELLCAFDELLLSELVWEELSRTLSELFFDGESDSGTPSV
jgi:hypothetical protein